MVTGGNSSRELAEIFGTSDDEDTEDFPADLNAFLDLSKPLTDIGSLETDADPKKFDASVFLNSIQESLAMERGSTAEKNKSTVPVSNDSGREVKEERLSGVEGVKQEAAPSQKEAKSLTGEEKVKEEPSSGPESGGDGSEREGGGGMQLRKSTRISRRIVEMREQTRQITGGRSRKKEVGYVL